MPTNTLKHEHVREYVLSLIRSGRLKPGDKTPSEYALANRFAANKTTCNKAMAVLVAEGYVERRKGAGTFVADTQAKGLPTIGVYMNLRPGSYFSQLLIAIQEEAYSRGYGLVFFQSVPFDSERQYEELLRYILASGIKGIIINRPDQPEFPSIHNLYLDTSVPDAKASQIQIDHWKEAHSLRSISSITATPRSPLSLRIFRVATCSRAPTGSSPSLKTTGWENRLCGFMPFQNLSTT